MSLLRPLLSLLLSSDLLLLSSANSITLSLSRVAPPSANPLENLKYLAAASLARAHHLIKCPNEPHLPLYPRSYGTYTVSLSFGTPLQTLGFEMDTGSSLVWSPCTNHYHCTHCPKHVPTFIPESSASYKNITCESPQCKWMDADPQCNNHTCGYIYEYGLGNTIRRLISETLTFPGLSVPDFIVGCSVSSDYTTKGIVGFARAWVSLPAQLGLTSFSYCMVSHDLDDNTTASSDLVLTTTRDGGKGHAANYTLFISNSASPYFYYVSLQNISIGRVHINVPAEFLVPDALGNGGTIVDSGAAFTHMGAPVFDLVFKELKKQVGKTYTRAVKIEIETGLKPCYNVPRKKNTKITTIHLPFPRKYRNGSAIRELLFVRQQLISSLHDLMNIGKVEWGPTITLGNYQQHDFYMDYDLENNRLGIRQQKCG